MGGATQNNIPEKKIYLIGSFYSFRDRIISALPDLSFSDPRTHPQSCVQKLVNADMAEAENCLIALAVFPKGKEKGVMSFAELGASAAHLNNILVVDETGEDDPLLKHIAKICFEKIDEAIDYLKTKPDFPLPPKNHLFKRYPVTAGNDPIPMHNIYFCGAIDDKVNAMVDEARKKRPDKKFIIKSGPVQDFQKINDYDLIVVNFPEEQYWDRQACFMMGAAYAYDIPVLLRENKDWRYPPLQALARRHASTLEGVLEYITEVDDQHISREAVNMYHFFDREMKRKNKQ